MSIVANSPSDLSIILVVAEQLRVPELKYRVDHTEGLDSAIAQFFEGRHSEAGSVTNHSIVKRVLAEFDDTSLPQSFNNLAFIVDRLFDVWLRKNKLAQEINDVIGSWRFAFFESLYTQRDQATLDAFVALLEKLAADNFGWCPFPLRSRPMLLNQLAEMSAALGAATQINQRLIIELTASWQEFECLQRQKYQRTTERLVALERNLAGSRYAQSQAQVLVNNRFNQRLITVSLQLFLQDHWLQLVAKAFELTQTPELLEQVRTLTNQLVLVFCNKGEAAFRYGDMLLDQLAQLFEELRMNQVPDALWRDLEQDIMAILQNQPITEKLYLKFSCYEPIQSFDSSMKPLAQEGQWFSCLVNNAEHRVCAVAIMEDSKHILFCNYLGIKAVNFGLGEFEQELRAGRYKLLQSEASLAQVIDTTMSGLSKVAASQQSARSMAAEKAKNEAEKLLAQKLVVDQQSKQKAAEIALQAKNMQLKQAEKQRIRQENEVLGVVSNLKLGAWICVVGEKEGEQEKQQFKLAVKLAATGKLIFVDKIGIKRREYSHMDLVQGIIEKGIEILSDGAEFDEHLEQALKRIRLSK